jgi:hypothetical protein
MVQLAYQLYTSRTCPLECTAFSKEREEPKQTLNSSKIHASTLVTIVLSPQQGDYGSKSYRLACQHLLYTIPFFLHPVTRFIESDQSTRPSPNYMP